MLSTLKKQQRLDFISQSLREQKHANLEVAMEEYTKVTGRKLPKLREEPKLADFYVPSEEQKDGEIMFVIGGMTLVALIAYKW